jgi:hypothetical protein
VPVVLALDAGTTGVRTRAVFTDSRPSVASYREFTQHFPQPGWVEHDAVEIWEAVKATLLDVLGFEAAGKRFGMLCALDGCTFVARPAVSCPFGQAEAARSIGRSFARIPTSPR